jgi:hypothetical protein
MLKLVAQFCPKVAEALSSVSKRLNASQSPLIPVQWVMIPIPLVRGWAIVSIEKEITHTNVSNLLR